jgi:predicted metal-dependent hydrolase
MVEAMQLALDFAAAQPQPQALPVWRHRAADRTLSLPRLVVAYVLRRGRRRSIGLTAHEDGLVVSAPRWTTLREVEHTLQAHEAWLWQQWQAQQRRAAAAQAQVAWYHGGSVPWRGQAARLQLGGAAAPGQLAWLQPLPQGSEPAWQLHVALPVHATEQQVRDTVQAWLKQQCLTLVQQSVARYAPLLGVHCQGLRLSSARSHWGLASADGRLALNWRLIYAPAHWLDYVVVHELAHLREMNHSPQFWALVQSVVPNCMAVRHALRQWVPPADR